MTSIEVRVPDLDVVSIWSSDMPPERGRAGAARLSLPGRPELSTDVFGVPPDGLHRRPVVHTELTLAIDVFAPDCPLGPVGTRLVARGNGSICSVPPEATPALDWDLMAIEAPYVQLLRWLHGSARLGSLLWLGCPGRGDWIGISAMAGIVQSPKKRVPESAVVDSLLVLCSD